jgi:5,10-methylenetetrahydromethanopterin reductase
MAESHGFDALSMYGDLTFQPPIVPLVLAAQVTRRIRLGPASLNPYSLHPIEIAGQIAMLDLVSNGRAYLGISRGAWLEAAGIEQHDPVTRVVETIGAVRHLLAASREAFEGEQIRFRAGLRLRYTPLRTELPMLLGSWGPRLIRRVAGLVDEVKIGGSANPDIVPLAASWIAGVNRPPVIVLGAVTVVDEDGQAARALVRREMALYLPVVAPLDPTVEVDPELLVRVRELVDAGKVDEAGRNIPDGLLERFAFAGTPAEIVEQGERIFAAGAGRIEFGTPHGLTPEHGLELLGRRVLPALARWRD